MEWITVATFNEPVQAQPLQRRLEGAGLPSRVHDERRLQRYWFLSETLAGVRLQVARRHYEAARGQLAEWDRTEGVLNDAIHCPECRSSEVEYPQFTRKFVFPSVYALLAKAGLFPKRFYCTQCHCTWPVKARPEPERDLLGWPRK